MIDQAELIARLTERAQNSSTATDEGGRVAAPPATEEQIVAAEKRVGTPLPEALKQMYRKVGDGGWGPGAGLVRLAEMGKPAAGLLPLCDWGGGITSEVDCAQPEAPIVRRDPNMPKADVAARVPAAMHFSRAALVKEACWVESASLESWLEAWLDGAALFYRAYDGGADEEEEDEEEDGEVEAEAKLEEK
jgi:hypothetical protein